MSAPAFIILESGRPLNFLGSQLLAFLSPFLKQIFSGVEYDRFVQILDRRTSIDQLIEAIAEQENRKDE